MSEGKTLNPQTARARLSRRFIRSEIAHAAYRESGLVLWRISALSDHDLQRREWGAQQTFRNEYGHIPRFIRRVPGSFPL